MNIGMKFYTYVHMRADDGKVFYVGKGCGARFTSHQNRNNHWRSTVKKHGLRVEIAAHWPSEAEAYSHERLLISCFRDMGLRLANRTDGGAGGGRPLGSQNSMQHRARISASKRGAAIGPPSEATKQKISASQKGVPRQYSRGDKNPMHRPEVRAKVSAANKGRTFSDETKEKMRAAKLGRPWTEARRAASKVQS